MTQQAKHTPGPWRYEDYKETPHVMGPAGPIAEIYGADKPHSTDANARLIAAAPELLAALNTLQLWPNQNCWCPLERAGAHRAGTKIHTTGCLKARAAIAKAEGH